MVRNGLYLLKLTIATGCSRPSLRKQKKLADIFREKHPLTRPRAGRKLPILAATLSFEDLITQTPS